MLNADIITRTELKRKLPAGNNFTDGNGTGKTELTPLQVLFPKYRQLKSESNYKRPVVREMRQVTGLALDPPPLMEDMPDWAD